MDLRSPSLTIEPTNVSLSSDVWFSLEPDWTKADPEPDPEPDWFKGLSLGLHGAA